MGSAADTDETPRRVSVRVRDTPLFFDALAILICLHGLGAPLRGQCSYDVTVIEAPVCPPLNEPAPAVGVGLSEMGEVVGYFLGCGGSTNDSAFRWDPSSGYSLLDLPPGSSQAHAVDGDQIVGLIDLTGDAFGNLAFCYDKGDYVNLGTLPGGTFSEALAVSARRVVGNWGNVVSGPIHGVIWSDNMVSLGDDLGTPSSRAYDVNAFGQVQWRGRLTGARRCGPPTKGR